MGSAGVRSAARPRPSPELPRGIELVWLSLAVLLPAVASFLAPMRMLDLAYQLRAGELMLDAGSLLRTEVFSFVDPGAPWLNQQWLAQLILVLPYKAGGFEALVLLRALLIGAMSSFLYLACRHRGASRTAAAALSVAGVVIAFPSLALRPQLLGAVLFTAALWLIASVDARPRRSWWLIPVSVAWANVHGSFFLVPALLAFGFLEARCRRRPGTSRRLLLIGTASTLATLATPYGVDGWRYVVELLANPDIRGRISEWAPPGLSGWEGWMILLPSLAIAAVLLRRRPRPWLDIVWTVGFIGLALMARRNIVWWGVAATWISAAHLPALEARSGRGNVALNAGVPGALAVLAVVLSPWVGGVRLQDAPVGLTAFVNERTAIGARLFAAQRYASWFELAAADRPVFVDSRIETFPSSIWDEYEEVAGAGPEGIRVIERWDVDAVAAEVGWPIVDRLREEPGWEIVYEGADGVLVVRA